MFEQGLATAELQQKSHIYSHHSLAGATYDIHEYVICHHMLSQANKRGLNNL